jgi:hypothetical protein
MVLEVASAGKLPTNTRVFPAIGRLGEAGGDCGASCRVDESLAAIVDEEVAILLPVVVTSLFVFCWLLVGWKICVAGKARRRTRSRRKTQIVGIQARLKKIRVFVPVRASSHFRIFAELFLRSHPSASLRTDGKRIDRREQKRRGTEETGDRIIPTPSSFLSSVSFSRE